MTTLHLLRAGVNPEVFGLIPFFIQDQDPRPAREQFNERYHHGGGWRPLPGWAMDDADYSITFYGDLEDGQDPPLPALGCMNLRDETIYLYESAWVAIVSPGKPIEVARLD